MLFPFIGDRIEVVISTGVRYTGEIVEVDSVEKSITMVKGKIVMFIDGMKVKVHISQFTTTGLSREWRLE